VKTPERHGRIRAVPAMSRILALLCLALGATACAEPVRVGSLEALAKHIGKNGQTVIMAPGTYELTDFLPLDGMKARRQRGEFPYLTFSGNDNTFIFDDVTLVVDTALRTALKPPAHSNEFEITGRDNTLRGLTIRTTGDGTSPGGALLAVRGADNTLRDLRLLVTGSHPYGYGDLFGKGAGPVISHRKHSGVLVTGNGTQVIDCRLVMRAFGHGFFVQNDAADVRFENCVVEGEMRSTDEMLAERSGPAFDVDFRMMQKNRDGQRRVLPGYMKSLCEDGFRTYGKHRNLVFRKCAARHMRAGFELRTRTGVRLENCVAVDNERGFWLSSGAVAENCRGNARFGPLFFLEGDGAEVDLTLLPGESNRRVHALGTVRGSNHHLRIAPGGDRQRQSPLPIGIGYGPPPAGEAMAPFPGRPAKNLRLTNQTRMPLIIGPDAERCQIETRGPVRGNQGKNIDLQPISDLWFVK
jgi:hypothetical protein